jgi:MFS transporter, PAT family, beta-lactamase induction signal transducer AmpG
MSFRLPEGVRPYFERAPLAALFLGVSSGFAFAMIGATLTTRLAQHGIDKRAVTAFALTFLAYNLKFLWAPMVDHVRLPVIGGYGQRRSWLWFVGVLVMFAVALLGAANPDQSIYMVAVAAIIVGVAGATFDIIIDAYRIELLEPRQLGAGSGMSQYGWRIGSAAAGALALVLAARVGWSAAYVACAAFALPAMLVGVVMGEPKRHREPAKPHGLWEAVVAYFSPLLEFLRRQGALSTRSATRSPT